jgi:hypothetical protein
MHKEEIDILVTDSINELKLILSVPENELSDELTTLIGQNGILDSLETITLLINIDEKIENFFGVSLQITNSVLDNLNISFTKNDLVKFIENKILEK